jgi:2-dehydro-3-deoxygalactonokinase
MQPPEIFYSCDWGTTHFRLRLVQAVGGIVLRELTSAEGVMTVAARSPTASREAAFATILLDAITRLGNIPAPVVISGMASSRMGWRELPYARAPLSLAKAGLVSARVKAGDFDVHILSGLATDEDVMRGEETELIGLSRGPSWPQDPGDFLVVMPGTHSKHITVRANTVTSFVTFITGEAYALLGTQSTLAFPQPAEPDDRAFTEGVETVRRLGLAAALFRVRSGVMLQRLAAEHSRSFLSGVLIGAELAAALDHMPHRQVVVAAGPQLTAPYQRALTVLGGSRACVIPPAEVAQAVVRGHGEFLRTLAAQNAC